MVWLCRSILRETVSEFLGHRVGVVLYDLLERTEWERKKEVLPFLPSDRS